MNKNTVEEPDEDYPIMDDYCPKCGEVYDDLEYWEQYCSNCKHDNK